MDDNLQELRNKAMRNSLAIAFFYVGFGTVSVLSVYPDSFLFGDWVYVGLLITLPVSIISFGIMYAEPNGYLMVLLVQLLIFLTFWFIIYKYLMNKYTSAERLEKKD